VVPKDNGVELPAQHIPQLPDTRTAQTLERNYWIITIHHVRNELCTAQHVTAAASVTPSSKCARKGNSNSAHLPGCTCIMQDSKKSVQHVDWEDRN
jgi:hypothetical protein